MASGALDVRQLAEIAGLAATPSDSGTADSLLARFLGRGQNAGFDAVPDFPEGNGGRTGRDDRHSVDTEWRQFGDKAGSPPRNTRDPFEFGRWGLVSQDGDEGGPAAPLAGADPGAPAARMR